MLIVIPDVILAQLSAHFFRDPERLIAEAFQDIHVIEGVKHSHVLSSCFVRIVD